MGASYSNITLRGPTQAAVLAALRGRDALVTPREQDCVVVFDAACDERGMHELASVCKRLSTKLGCPALGVLVHDDDVLWYHLYLSGELADTYDSAPGYFSDTDQPISAPAGGDAQVLADAFMTADSREVDEVLRKPKVGRGGYVFESQRHGDLVAVLALPEWGVGFSYANLDSGEYPEGLTDKDVRRPRSGTAPKRRKANSEFQQFTDQLIQGFLAQGRRATALGEAARWGRLDLVQQLVSSGLSVNETNESGYAPLALAASGGHPEIVQYLIDRGADVNAGAGGGMTPLLACVAAMHSKRVYLAVAESLLRAGAWKSLGAKTGDGWTALDWAKRGRPEELVELISSYLKKSRPR